MMQLLKNKGFSFFFKDKISLCKTLLQSAVVLYSKGYQFLEIVEVDPQHLPRMVVLTQQPHTIVEPLWSGCDGQKCSVSLAGKHSLL